MKTLTLITTFLFYSIISFAGNEVPIDSVINYVGKSVTVCAKVFGSKTFEKVTLLNLGAKHPDNPLTVAIQDKDRANFSLPPDQLFTDKLVCITGMVKLYKGKAEIVISKPEEIVIKEERPAGK